MLGQVLTVCKRCT